jgi:PTS system nitrogen regulatory IIA component
VVDLARILSPACTGLDVDVHSRKRALEWISERMAAEHAGLDAREVLLALQARERLGSTGLGEGIAIPHSRIAHDQIIGVFIRLREPIEYDAPDNQPIDLMFGLIVPETETSEHLKVLATLSRAFASESITRRMRAATNAADLRAILLEGAQSAEE